MKSQHNRRRNNADGSRIVPNGGTGTHSTPWIWWLSNSQGKVVTLIRWDGLLFSSLVVFLANIYNYNILQVRWEVFMYIHSFLTNQLVKEFWKLVHICQSYYQTSRGYFFGTQCISEFVKATPKVLSLLIYGRNDAKHNVFFSVDCWFGGSDSHWFYFSGCSKWCPFAFTHAHNRFLSWIAQQLRRHFVMCLHLCQWGAFIQVAGVASFLSQLFKSKQEAQLSQRDHAHFVIFWRIFC